MIIKIAASSVLIVAICLMVLGSDYNMAVDAVSVGDYEYQLIIDGSEAEIIGYKGTETDIVIPREINGYQVTSIGARAFYSKRLTSVSIPDSIKYIKEYAFTYNKLTDVTFPDSVISISHNAFTHNRLVDVIIGEGIETIEGAAFADNNLESVTIYPKSITIQKRAFINNQSDASDLTIYGHPGTEVEVLAEEMGYTFKDVMLGDYEYRLINDGKEAEISSYTGTGGDIDIPGRLKGYKVTGIGNDAFSNKEVTSVVIPETVINIGRNAFAVNRIQNLIIGESVETIEYGAFRYNRLTDVIIPDSSTTIDAYAFHANQISSLVLGDSLINIGHGAFESNQLSSVEIPDNVVSVGDKAFARNQLNPADFTVYGVIGSAAERLAMDKGYRFIELIKESPDIRVEFSDVEKTDWFYEQVSELVAIGGINGYPDGTFRPAVTMKKGEFVKLIVGGLGYPQANAADGHWAANYIRKAEDLGILALNEFPLYTLNDDITRNEMAMIAAKSIGLDDDRIDHLVDYKESIRDYSSIETEYQEYVLKAYAMGMLTGYPDGEFKGNKTLTRAEAATVALRILKPEYRVTTQ